LVFTPDPKAHEITIGVNGPKVEDTLPKLLSGSLTTPATPQKNLIGPNGTAIAVQEVGVPGTQLADPSGVSAAVAVALAGGRSLALTVAIEPQSFKVEEVAMDPEYLVPNGARWVEISKSAFTLTRWEGTTPLTTWTIVIGRPSAPTPVGIFHVWLMVPLQDMIGDDYHTKDVPWNAYFAGDNAMHGNYWVDSFGWAASHGCIGMPIPESKVLYDWLDIGTLVIVHN
jgi:hypothetical protein